MENGVCSEHFADWMYSHSLGWYAFTKGSFVLYIQKPGYGDMEFPDSVAQCLSVSIAESAKEEFLEKYRQQFDYVVVMGVLEHCREPETMLSRWRQVLKHTGKLLLGVHNRLGIRYFCGDRDPFTGKCFDSLEGYKRYRNADMLSCKGRLYGKGETETMLVNTGFDRYKFYSVMPDLDIPQMIYAQDVLPGEDLQMRYFPIYNHPDTVFLNEEIVCQNLIENGLFHLMANACFYECSQDGVFAPINQVTLSLDRGKENALFTILRSDRTVVKKAVVEEAKGKPEIIRANERDLLAHGIQMVPSKLEEGLYTMPYIDAELANRAMQRILLEDKEAFISLMDRFRELILRSSEHIEENALGIILKKGYFDLVPLNSFYSNGDFVFFDQEFCVENYPANAIIYRAVDMIYGGDPRREEAVPQSFFWDRYNMGGHLGLWRRMSDAFTGRLRNQDMLEQFNSRHRAHNRCIEKNRERMEISEYYRNVLLEGCFADIAQRKIIVFGTGKYADKFMALYRNDCEIEYIIDSDPQKWGKLFYGYQINNPEILKGMDPDSYKVILCAKDYETMLARVCRMDMKYIGIYDKNYMYPGSWHHAPAEHQGGKHKKFHTGYIAGVFDLYHLGHLNMFRRAKEQCEYLIAGVVTDEYVRNEKNKEPFIPFQERLEMVRACKYVDEAVEVPYRYGGTEEAFQKYHFDCQFSGSDYLEHPWWLAQKSFLEEHGAELVFLPYTEQTNSTKIRELINRNLV